MMMKLAVVLCVVMAANMAVARVAQDEEMAELVGMMIAENALADDDVTADGWLKKAWGHVQNVAKGVGGACSALGHSPEEAREQMRAAFPNLDEELITEEWVHHVCNGAHAINRFGR